MFKIDYKFRSTKLFTFIYLLLFLFALFLTIGRWASQYTTFVIINSEINSHISNFSLSLLAYLGIGYTWLFTGINFNRILLLGVVFVLGNIYCETLMTFLNIPDIIDAYFGIAGTLLAFAYLLAVKVFGLIPIDDK